MTNEEIQSQLALMSQFGGGGDSLDTVTGFGPGTSQYDAYRSNIDRGEQMARSADPGKGGMFGSATEAFKLAALAAAGAGAWGGFGAAGAGAGGAGASALQPVTTGGAAMLPGGTGLASTAGGMAAFPALGAGAGVAASSTAAGGGLLSKLGSLFGGSGSMDANSWLQVAGLASNLLGSYQQGQTQDDMLKRLTTTLGTNTLSGPGGASAYSNANGAGVNLGDLASLFSRQNNFANTASGMASGALTGGLPAGVSQYGGALNSQPLDLSQFLSTQSGAGQLGSSALAQALNPNNTAQQIGQQQLDLMRAQAKPQEDAAMQSFLSNMYGSGRGAVTGAVGSESSIGGGRLAAAFGQGLGNADLQRQIAAQAQGQSAAQSQSTLMGNAFQRFSDMSNLGSTANTASFNRQRGVMTDAYGRAVSESTLPAGISSAFQNLVTSGQGGALGVADYGNSLISGALQNSSANANARIGSGNSVASYMNGGNYSSSPVLDAFSSFAAGGSQPSNGVSSFFQNLFGNGSKQIPNQQNPYTGYGA